jgi:hypothetical protein
MDPVHPPSVRRRSVFYVSGFDPKGAAHYHGLYREQAALQHQAGGLPIEVGPRRKLDGGDAEWRLHAVEEGVEVDTRYGFLHWDDVVRAHWPRSRWEDWTQMVVASLFYLRHGAWWKMFRLAWPPAVAMGIPFALLLAALVGVPAVGALVAWHTHRFTASIAWASGFAAAAGLGLLLAARRLETRFDAYWIVRSVAFTRLQALGRAPSLEQRLDAHAARVAQSLAGDDDEVLVVGHSSGANMACEIVARALRQRGFSGAAHPRLSLLTLGQWVPLLGTLPHAQVFRAELAELAQAEGLDWIDFSAPPDGCCFALCDPVTACGVQAGGRHPGRPKLLSPRFAELFEPGRYRELRRDKMRMHFQYLMASQRPGDYDFFRITAGARTLGQRYRAVDGVIGYGKLKFF